MSRLPTDRRTLLKAGLAAPIALQVNSAAAVSRDLTMFGSERLFTDVQSYTEAGNKQSGGEGDRWTADWTAKRLDRKSVVSGKSVSVRVDLGGRRIIKKKKKN